MTNDAAKITVLVVDDEPQIRRLLTHLLTEQGYNVKQAANGQEAILVVAQRKPDVIVLDLGLPDMDGLEVLRRIREWSEAPIIILSVRDSDRVKVEGLDWGADDYLTKPFSTGEFMARLRVALRHARAREGAGESAVFRTSTLEVDVSRRSVTSRGKPVRLTPTEFSLLRLFIRHAGKVLTHPQIMEKVWGSNYVDRVNYLHVYVTHLREKIEHDPSHPEIILNEPGVGYKLVKN